jgi:hypothetical protein
MLAALIGSIAGAADAETCGPAQAAASMLKAAAQASGSNFLIAMSFLCLLFDRLDNGAVARCKTRKGLQCNGTRQFPAWPATAQPG